MEMPAHLKYPACGRFQERGITGSGVMTPFLDKRWFSSLQ